MQKRNEMSMGLKVKTRKAKMKRKSSITSIDKTPIIKELKQNIQQKAQRIRKYEKRTKFDETHENISRQPKIFLSRNRRE